MYTINTMPIHIVNYKIHVEVFSLFKLNDSDKHIHTYTLIAPRMLKYKNCISQFKVQTIAFIVLYVDFKS